MMEGKNLVKKLEEDIRNAVEAYKKHTCNDDIIRDISDAFIERLAEDSAEAKSELREMFRKSPVWDEELQALVINGTRTHNPDYYMIRNLALEIFYDKLNDADYELDRDIRRALLLFEDPEKEEYEDLKEYALEAINKLAPKAYAPGKKLSRVFKALCDALGVSDETAGSEFQRLFAKIADELSAKKIDFKLYASINPAHILTMSNPKDDERGSTLTSCHSLNSTDYPYNNGCSGYARDSVTFIVFTVANPEDPESFYNRKTTRQIFAYKPGNGLLLQSRMYNTYGGTYGAQKESKVYRDLIQREISDIEGAVNLWDTYKATGDHRYDVRTGDGFGGYPDWHYDDFDAKISIRKDHQDDYDCITVGTYGLCVMCGRETSEGMYCYDCDNRCHCDDCDEYVNETFPVYDSYGDLIYVCEDCRDRHYTYCDVCGEYHHDSVIHYVDGRNICESCFDDMVEECDECRALYLNENMVEAINRYGDRVMVCQECADHHYSRCEECGEVVHDTRIHYVHNRTLCNACFEVEEEEVEEE